jgi:flagellar motor protein MotB
MFASRSVGRKRRTDEAEKPFWISFSDLMMALMVLFLVVMTVALLSVTQRLRDVQKEELERAEAIDRMVDELKVAATHHQGVSITGNRDRVVIEFGDAARFAFNDYRISREGAERLRSFVPPILAMANSDDGRKWFKRVIVEGFTDTDGTYLHNLHLSLMRAESVVCTLLQPATKGFPLDEPQMKRVRELFMVGGFSSNSSRASKDESRRVELRLDFRTTGVDADPSGQLATDIRDAPTGVCRI